MNKKNKKPRIIVRHHGRVPLDPLGEKPQAQDVLLSGCQALDHAGAKYFLTDGTLLGYHRQGELIPHDTDLDVFVFALDAFRVDSAMTLFGFTHVRTMAIDNRIAQLCYAKDDVLFDIQEVVPRGNVYVLQTEHGEMKIPGDYVRDFGEINVAGHKLPTPEKIEDYLAWRYGDDWRTPKMKKEPWESESPVLEPYKKS